MTQSDNSARWAIFIKAIVLAQAEANFAVLCPYRSFNADIIRFSGISVNRISSTSPFPRSSLSPSVLGLVTIAWCEAALFAKINAVANSSLDQKRAYPGSAVFHLVFFSWGIFCVCSRVNYISIYCVSSACWWLSYACPCCAHSGYLPGGRCSPG